MLRVVIFMCKLHTEKKIIKFRFLPMIEFVFLFLVILPMIEFLLLIMAGFLEIDNCIRNISCLWYIFKVNLFSGNKNKGECCSDRELTKYPQK